MEKNDERWIPIEKVAEDGRVVYKNPLPQDGQVIIGSFAYQRWSDGQYDTEIRIERFDEYEFLNGYSLTSMVAWMNVPMPYITEYMMEAGYED